MTASLTKKHDALNQVRLAATVLAVAQPGFRGYTATRFREANAHLVLAQMAAADTGATAQEITAASEWNGMAL